VCSSLLPFGFCASLPSFQVRQEFKEFAKAYDTQALFRNNSKGNKTDSNADGDGNGGDSVDETRKKKQKQKQEKLGLQEICQRICETYLEPDKYQLSNSRVFLKDGQLELLDVTKQSSQDRKASMCTTLLEYCLCVCILYVSCMCF
jgi:hypothetical protein